MTVGLWLRCIETKADMRFVRTVLSSAIVLPRSGGYAGGSAL